MTMPTMAPNAPAPTRGPATSAPARHSGQTPDFTAVLAEHSTVDGTKDEPKPGKGAKGRPSTAEDTKPAGDVPAAVLGLVAQVTATTGVPTAPAPAGSRPAAAAPTG